LSYRPSAAFVLGLYAGAIAGLAVLPAVLFAFVIHNYNAYDLALEQAAAIADARAMVHEVAGLPRLDRAPHLRAILVEVGGTLRVERGDPALAQQLTGVPEVAAICASDRPRLAALTADTWAWACARAGETHYLIAVNPDIFSIPRVLLLIFGLASVVGLITALLIRRALTPLGQISSGLARVTAGERDVRLALTGLSELDELIHRVNATAAAVDEREDQITARIKTAQRIARIVAHEVRNPLQSIEMLLAVLVEEPSSVERTRLAEAMHEEVQLLDQVVSRMLKSSIGDDIELQTHPFDVGRLLARAYELHAPAARSAGVTLTLAADTPLSLEGDQALLGRCIENLILNALQHARSLVTISASITVGRLALEISDDGPGIDPLVADRLFEANVSQRRGGAGLGLALVHAVVQAHGGQVTATGAPGGGARFIIELPIRQTASGEPTIEDGLQSS